MQNDLIKISRVIKSTSSNPNHNYYSVICIQEDVKGIEVDHVFYENNSNSIFFLDPKYQWKIKTNENEESKGYILFLDHKLMDNPTFNKLLINEIKLFNPHVIPKVNPSPGISVRVEAILEMIDELLGSDLNNKENAILSLLNTFFIYCDGQCNIKSSINNSNGKTNIVYRFKNLVSKNYSKHHEVANYAELLNISAKYLNECVKEVLKVNAKSIIIEQLIMKARHKLKFTNESIKEICYELGFSSSDYFCYFFKHHTGYTPSAFRKL